MRAARVDQNQRKIVKELRQLGCSVRSTAVVGDGFPDICVGYRGENYLFEIKNPDLPPSGRKLTPMEEAFDKAWKGQSTVITKTSEALMLMGHPLAEVT